MDKFIWKIEIPGYITVSLFFLSIWITEYRWRLFFSAIFFMFATLAGYGINEQRKKDCVNAKVHAEEKNDE